MAKQPLVSVVMSAYNAEAYLKEAIQSILAQTYTEFEFIIINDGSSDGSEKIIRAFDDHRIKLISRKNKGMPASLNEGISKARGKYIARQDADDISLPDRLAKQVSFLETHPDVGMLGTRLRIINKDGDFTGHINLLTKPDDLKLAEVFSNQFGHGSLMIRKTVLNKVGGYDVSVPISEDYDLWTRLSRVTKVSNFKEALYLWRLHAENVSTASETSHKVTNSAFRTANREFDYYLRHKDAYRFFSFHPFSMPGGPLVYLKRKAAVYRDMALMYCYRGLRRKALPITLLAIAHAPWEKRSYQQLWAIFKGASAIAALHYELF